MMESGPRIIIPGIVQLPSGLLVPSTLVGNAAANHEAGLAQLTTGTVPDHTILVVGEPPSDMDALFVAPDPEAFGGRTPSLEAICQTLREVPVEPAMIALGAIAAAVWHAGTDQERHLRIAEEIFAGRPLLDSIRAFVRQDSHHVAFNEQHLTILMRLLLMHGADGDARADMTDEQVDALLISMVAVAGLTSRNDGPDAGQGRPMGWAPWLVRSGLYFDRSNLGSDQGRARALFVDLAGEEEQADNNWIDIASWFAEDLAPIADQFAFGYAMGAFSKALSGDIPTRERFIGILTEGLLGDNMTAAQVSRLIAASSSTRAEFIEILSENDDLDHLVWDRSPFERRPFLRLGDGRVVLMSPRFLHSWMGEGIYYRLLDAAGRRRDPRRPAKRATLRFTRFNGELTERYVRRLTERSHVDQIRAGVVRISGEQTYTGKRGTEQKSPDLLLSYATDVVVVEVTGGRPARRTRVLSDPTLIERELDNRVIGKLRELDRALIDILDGTASIPEIELDLVERVWPVLVIPSTIIQTEVLWQHIEQVAPTLFTHHPTLQPPTLFSVEDLERALSAVETGEGLPAILGTRLASVYRRMPPSHFFQHHYRSSRRPAYLDEQLLLVGQEARAALRL
jgi:hypothetical protein